MRVSVCGAHDARARLRLSPRAVHRRPQRGTGEGGRGGGGLRRANGKGGRGEDDASSLLASLASLAFVHSALCVRGMCDFERNLSLSDSKKVWWFLRAADGSGTNVLI